MEQDTFPGNIVPFVNDKEGGAEMTQRYTDGSGKLSLWTMTGGGVHGGQCSMGRPLVEDAKDLPGHIQGDVRHRSIRSRRGPRDSIAGRSDGAQTQQTTVRTLLDKDPHLSRL